MIQICTGASDMSSFLVQSSQCLTVNFMLTLTSIIEFLPKILGISIQEKLGYYDNSKIAVSEKFL